MGNPENGPSLPARRGGVIRITAISAPFGVFPLLTAAPQLAK
jgi:hypothetical protein